MLLIRTHSYIFNLFFFQIIKFYILSSFIYFRKSQSCDGALGNANAGKCGRPAGIAFNDITRELYVADAALGLHVIHARCGSLAQKIADSVDGKPFVFLDGLDVDNTTGVVYFTSFSTKFSAG